MKHLLALLVLISSTAFAAPDKANIEKRLPEKLKNVKSVEVLDLDRRVEFILACSLHPDICFDGIKEYSMELRVHHASLGDLDFDCDADQYLKKKIVNIKFCSRVGHNVEFKTLVKDGATIVTIQDK